MGSDGARGAKAIKNAGGYVVAQDEATSVVWGMPGAVVSGGLADKICPLHEIGREIVNRISNGRARGNAAPGARRMNAGK